MGGLFAAISSKTGQKPKDVKAVFTSLQGIATSEVTKNGKFAIPQVVMLKLKHKPARPAGKHDVRQGGEGGGEEGLEGGEGLPRLGHQEVHLRILPGVGEAVAPLRCGRCQSWSCHGVPRPQHRMVRQAVCTISRREKK